MNSHRLVASPRAAIRSRLRPHSSFGIWEAHMPPHGRHCGAECAPTRIMTHAINQQVRRATPGRLQQSSSRSSGPLVLW
jgi:hypothetical protein